MELFFNNSTAATKVSTPLAEVLTTTNLDLYEGVNASDGNSRNGTRASSQVTDNT